MTSGSAITVRVFFSVDLVESATFKASSELQGGVPEWVQAFTAFFQQFPLDVAKQVDRDFDEGAGSAYDAVWKILGDEIVFSYAIDNWDRLRTLCLGFYRAFMAADQQNANDGKPRLKGHAWTAQFPYPNRELRLSGRDAPDYLGQDIDLGFRLGGVSRPGRFLVSLDLAERLALLPVQENFAFHRVGWESLKGVQGGEPYPLIWLRLPEHKRVRLKPWDDHLCPYTRAFLGPSEVGPREVEALAIEMRQTLAKLKLFRPYLPGEPVPDGHREILEAIRRNDQRAQEEVELADEERDPLVDAHLQ